MTTRETVQDTVQVEVPRVKGSRFLAQLSPAAELAQAEAVVAAVRATEPGASHHAWAWRGDGVGQERSSDDGEVRGTAGPPILARLTGAALHGVVLVVTRYYGGTSLGKGGLIRAYGAAAAAALDAAEIVSVEQLSHLTVRCSYGAVGPLEGVLAQHGAAVVSADYSDTVTLVVAVPVAQAAALEAAIRERSAGQASVEPTTP